MSNDTLFQKGATVIRKDYSVLKNLFMFSGLGDEALCRIYSSVKLTTQAFSKGETIFDKAHYEKRIGFVLSGECKVMRRRNKSDSVELNRISKYGSFGILSLFTPNAEFPTEIVASKNCTVLFIEAEDVQTLISEYREISLAVIGFLAQKVAFLNRKLATFSNKCVEDKLTAYLRQAYEKHGDELCISMAELSREADIGRASLYRMLSSLEEKGIIKAEPKKIVFINPEGLERIKK